MNQLSRLLIGGALLLALTGAANAEASQVRFARQLGLGYLQFYVCRRSRCSRVRPRGSASAR